MIYWGKNRRLDSRSHEKQLSTSTLLFLVLYSDTNSECEFHAHLNSSWPLTLKMFTIFVVYLFFQHRVPIFLCFKDQKLAHLKLKYYIRGPPAKSLVKSRRSTQKSDSLWKRRRIVPGTPENYYWGLSIWIEYYRIWEGLIIIVGWLLVQDLKNIQDSHIHTVSQFLYLFLN